MPIGSIVSGIGSAIGGLFQGHAISSAADAANRRADQARQDLMPWATGGRNALNVTADLSGANGPDAATAAFANYRTSPGYQWQLGQGLQAIDRGAASSGILNSGATLKAEQTFGSGLADQDFSNYYNRLFDLSKLGETAAAGQGAASLNAAETDLSAGGAQASVIGNITKGIGTTVNSLFSNPKVQGGGEG